MTEVDFRLVSGIRRPLDDLKKYLVLYCNEEQDQESTVSEYYVEVFA